MENGKYIIGVDTGGTFTDVVCITEQGDLFTAKASTTPSDFSIGVMDTVDELAKSLKVSRSDLLAHCKMFKHGTTMATNALINRKVAKVGLITTKGFEDTTMIMRAIGRVAGLSEDEIKHQATCVKPEPLVPRDLIRGVTERIDFRGDIVSPLNLKEAREAVRNLVEDCHVEAIAVNFLFSFINPVHERKIHEMIQEMYGDMDIFCSFASELVPVTREYARSNTVILNSSLGQSVQSYITNLSSKLAGDGYQHRLLLMQANGGLTFQEDLQPIATLSSGPAGGVFASKYMADLLKHPNVITTDMGGTSFDVSLIIDGYWQYAREPIVERFHITWPMIDVESIGAGGGTIVRADHTTHRLIVGPDSAGADPGPVCYDMGAINPTVTDADLILGYLDPDFFLGGRKKLDKNKTITALREKIAVPLGMNEVEAAAGIYEIINAHMSDLVRKKVVTSGYTPEEFVLYSFGGAGPVHAAAFAAQTGVKEVYVFPTSAVFSAFGIATADIVHTHIFSYQCPMPTETKALNERLSESEQRLLNVMESEGVNPKDVEFRRTFHMRYRRQLNELDLIVPASTYNDEDINQILIDFDRRYEEVYGEGTAYREAGTELISITMDAIGRVPKPLLVSYPRNEASPSKALKGTRDVYFGDDVRDFVKTKVYDYDKLTPGSFIEGPAIIETPITTIVIPPRETGEIDSYRNVEIKIRR